MNSQLVIFYDNNLYITIHNNEPYILIKPFINKLNLNPWQHYKQLMKETKWEAKKLPTKISKKHLNSIHIPLRKLFGWLCSIPPTSPDHEKIITQYQNECDRTLLHQYLTLHSDTENTKIITKETLNSLITYTQLGKERIQELLEPTNQASFEQKISHIHDAVMDTAFLAKAI